MAMTTFIGKLIYYAASGIELCGIFLVIAAVLKEMYIIIFKHKFSVKNTERDTTMNQGLASALGVLLGAEILKTIAYRDMGQLIEVGALMLIRVFMTLLIHWELTHKLREDKRERELNAE